MNIIVIGSGSYVSGRGTDGYGTVMPAVCEWKRSHPEGAVYVVGTHGHRMEQTKLHISELQHKMGIKFPIFFYPSLETVDQNAYHTVISQIQSPKAAIIGVPDHLHFQIAKDVMESGFHCLIAKPLTPSFPEALCLYELQKKIGVHCAVEFHKRYDEANLKLKDVLRKDEIGEPLYFIVEYSQQKRIPSENFITWVAKSNVFQYLGVHYVDMIYFLTGALPKRVMAFGQKKWLIQKGIDNYDAIQGVIEWENEVGQQFLSYIFTHWIDPNKSSALSDQKIQVIGTKGKFISDQKFRGIHIVTDEMGVEEPSPYYTFGYEMDGLLRYRGYGIESIKQFLNSAFDISQDHLQLTNLSEQCVTLKQALVSTAVIDTINKSLESHGTWKTIPDLKHYL